MPYASLIWQSISEEAQDLVPATPEGAPCSPAMVQVKMILVADPKKRVTLQQIESHPFISSPVAAPDGEQPAQMHAIDTLRNTH